MTTSFRWVARIGALLLLAGFSVPRAGALGFEAFGPAEEGAGVLADGPRGVDDILRHGTRAYWCDVNGNASAYYDGNTEALNELLALFSRIDMAEHAVVIRPGRPSAESFHGKLTPYVVQFEVPGGIYLFHIREFAGTGLYSATPRMIVHLDAKLTERLGELKIPENVTLYDSAIRLDDALAHAYDEDPTLRYRAVSALADLADSSAASIKALNRAAADENESIRKLGERGMAQLAAAGDSDEQTLRQRLKDFVAGHPQRARLPSPEDMLAALREADAAYAKGFTVRGTRVDSAPNGAGRLVAWTITMGNERLVLEQRDVEDADHPPAEGRSEYTIYAGPERMGSIHGYRHWREGRLLEMKPHATFEPVGSTYDLLIGRALWPLGRGFSRCADRITRVAAARNGLLEVTAEEENFGLARRWELVIDPAAGYLVRAAKGFDRDETEPSRIVETAGVLSADDRSVAHTARWIEGVAGLPDSIAVTSVSGAVDEELIKKTEERLERLREEGR